MSDFQSLSSALKTYKINTGHYPSTEQGLKALVERPTIPPLPDDWVKIADKVPTDPWKNEYRYHCFPEGSPQPFELISNGPDGIEGTKDDRSSSDLATEIKAMLRSFSYTFVGLMALLVAFLLLDSCPGGNAGKPQRIKADFTSLSSALESYRNTTGNYPTTDQGLMALVTRPETLPEESDWQPIANRIPTDPWKNEYRYRRLPDKFELRSIGPDGIARTEDDRVSE